MIGDPFPADKLFSNFEDHLARHCYVRVTGLTNTGVASYIHGSLLSNVPSQSTTTRGPVVLEGMCIAAFSDRKHEMTLVPLGADFEITNGVQDFSAHQLDRIHVEIRGSSPVAGTGYTAILNFASDAGLRSADKMVVPISLQGNFLIGTTALVRNRQTTFTFAFVEGDPALPG